MLVLSSTYNRCREGNVSRKKGMSSTREGYTYHGDIRIDVQEIFFRFSLSSLLSPSSLRLASSPALASPRYPVYHLVSFQLAVPPPLLRRRFPISLSCPLRRSSTFEGGATVIVQYRPQLSRASWIQISFQIRLA